MTSFYPSIHHYQVPQLKSLAEQSCPLSERDLETIKNNYNNELFKALAESDVLDNNKKIDEPISLSMNATLFPDMKYEINRLKSFEKDWPHHFIKPEDCASVGLFFLGKDDDAQIRDRVQCAFCNGIISHWEEGDKPIIEHVKYFPMCPYLLRQNVGNVPITGKNGLQKWQVSNSCPERSPANCSVRYKLLAPSSNSQPKYPSMSFYDKRLETFKIRNVEPLFIHISPSSLAEAGLFYAGVADVVQCFYCGGQMGGWCSNDNAWTEHAKHFPSCPFVKSVKGSSFVQQARSSAGAEAYDRNMSEPSCSTSQNTQAPQTTNSINVSNKMESMQISPEISETNNTSSEEKFLCKICMESTTRVAFLPCGHSLACPTCAKELKKCPLCRGDIQSYVRLYFD